MNHFRQIAEKLDHFGLDAMLLTCEANRFYATGFHSTGTDGAALVTRRKAYYLTDSRYTEAAARYVQNAEIQEVRAGRGYTVLLREIMESQGLCRVGFEDAYMTVRDYEAYRKALPCELVPATELLLELRRVKDSQEIETLIAAQRIADQLEAAGLKVTLSKLAFADYTAALAAGNFDLYLGEVVLTADFDLSPLLSSTGTLNYGGWQDGEADLLLADLRGASGPQRKTAAQALFAYLEQQVPIAPICFKNGSVLTQWGRLSGLAPVRGNVFAQLENWSIS